LHIPFVVVLIGPITAAFLASAIHVAAFVYVEKLICRGKRVHAADALLCTIVVEVRASLCGCGLHLRAQLMFGHRL
jgi:hypothetical protein